MKINKLYLMMIQINCFASAYLSISDAFVLTSKCVDPSYHYLRVISVHDFWNVSQLISMCLRFKRHSLFRFWIEFALYSPLTFNTHFLSLLRSIRSRICCRLEYLLVCLLVELNTFSRFVPFKRSAIAKI